MADPIVDPMSVIAQQQRAFKTGSQNQSNTPPPPETVVKDGHLFQYDPLLGQWTDLGKAPGPGGSGGSSWSGTYKNDTLTAAQDAMSAFLQAQSLADARRLSALDTVQKLGQFALPAGATTAPGFEEGGPAQQAAAMLGRTTYTPPPITPTHVNPAQLANPPAIDPTVLAMIAAIKDAANKGSVVTTGGSQSYG